MKHKFVLQKLGQVIRNFGTGVFYPRKTFEKVSYNGCPVIYTSSRPLMHPDLRDVTAGTLPAGYRIVGQITNTALDGDLQCADALITDDALSAEMRSHPDRFGVSSGFWGRAINGVMYYVDAANHVLLFPREAGNPNDGAAQVCNARDDTVILPMQLESGFKTMTDVTTPTVAPQQVGNAMAEEPKAESGAMSETDQIRQDIARLVEENENLKAMLAQLMPIVQALNQQQAAASAPMPAAAAQVGNVAAESPLAAENAQLKKRIADIEWQQLESTLPAGLRGDVNRMQYDADPAGFMRRALMATQQAQQVVNTAPQAEGYSFLQPAKSGSVTSFVTPQYAASRQIGNVAAQPPAEGSRLGDHEWQMHGGLVLDSSLIDASLGLKRVGREVGRI